ncbi:glycosyltransferase [Maritimibacter sp. UBA3975]|uniref:glycosyltransferase family 2 protein n=1 Tax=Maritimibacter sp. UBA3975 TaxID=1946833 RepID=UPI000C0BB06A|nr:glycosyltransferase [Maritimibacter sp. UBA3975]MAM63154.1 glycosyltransferase [Maritimibacter sp.]|tara:strand:+ start:45655 stop:46620 length:966 start_codon:yes stop_codon:yes gene_type:complete
MFDATRSLLAADATPITPGAAGDIAAPTRVVVGIPTTGRPAILPETVRAIARQRRLPDLVILSVATEDDLGDLDTQALPFPVEVVTGPKGATLQRNRMMRRLGREDVLLLLDDDFLMAPDFVGNTLAVFRDNPDVVIATGTVLADGILGAGMDHATGARRLAELSAAPGTDALSPIYAGYGCNMAFRARAALDNDIRFDEALPLYSWLEDVDFSRRLARHGRVVKAGSMRGVHLGTKTGRTPGVFLGYSQIANPIYLMRKGTMNRRHAWEMILRNMASNLLRSPRPPAWCDYRGRLRGNLIAIRDVLRSRDAPDRITQLTP